MAQTLPSVSLPAGVWVDLYAATSITVGVQLITQNIGNTEVRLSESVAEPTSSVGNNILYPSDFLQSIAAPVGVWAWSRNPGLLQVEEA